MEPPHTPEKGARPSPADASSASGAMSGANMCPLTPDGALRSSCHAAQMLTPVQQMLRTRAPTGLEPLLEVREKNIVYSRRVNELHSDIMTSMHSAREALSLFSATSEAELVAVLARLQAQTPRVQRLQAALQRVFQRLRAMRARLLAAGVDVPGEEDPLLALERAATEELERRKEARWQERLVRQKAEHERRAALDGAAALEGAATLEGGAAIDSADTANAGDDAATAGGDGAAQAADAKGGTAVKGGDAKGEKLRPVAETDERAGKMGDKGDTAAESSAEALTSTGDDVDGKPER